MITRRSFLASCGITFVVPLVAAAQPTAPSPRVAVWGFDPAPAFEGAFREGLRNHGYVEKDNIRIDFRYVSGSRGPVRERQDAMASEILALKPDVIVTASAMAVAFKRVATSVPVVFVAVSDPVGFGLADSLARPGGNFTGLSYQGVDLNVKRLELLTEALPTVKHIGVLGTRTHPLFERAREEVERAAQALKVQLHIVTVADGHPEDIDTAIAALTQRGVGAVLGLQGGMLYFERRRVVELALRNRLPGMFELTEWAELGGLMAYSASLSDLFRRAAGYVAKILKGAKPGDLPIEQPTKFELVINKKTAKALGLTIPPVLLLRADQIID